MPGILGVVDEAAPQSASLGLVRAMADGLRVQNRLRVEIDDDGHDGPAVLGRVHLGIFDASAIPADPDYRLVVDGEVNGFSRGARDILAAYRERGERALVGLSGSFALALWDVRRRRLYLANDRFGLRNVYYVATPRRFVFAPQVGALLADPSVPRTLDPQAVAEFLTFQCVLGNRTLIEDVRLLPPASLLVFEPGSTVRIEETWRLRYRPEQRSDHARAIADAVAAATSRHTESSHRVGLPLSGGLDSRTLLAAADGRRLATITYGRRDSDDMALARRLAAVVGADHHRIILPPGYIVAEARAMVRLTDGMHSCLNAHAALLRRAEAVCDVVLLGNGGDCLLDGLWNGPDDADDDAIAARLLPKLGIGLSATAAAELVAPHAPFAEVAARAAAGLRTALASVDGDSAADRADAFNVVHRHRRWVLQGVPAQSTHVEFRHPYYDDGVVAAALAVPAALRTERRAHVEALKLLSPALARIRRQGKPFGFAVPAWRWQIHQASGRVRDAVRWRATRAGLNPFLARPRRTSFADYDDELRHGSRRLLTHGLLAPRTLERGFWNPNALRRAVGDHLDGRANHAAALGVILTLELFAEEILERATRAWSPPLRRTG